MKIQELLVLGQQTLTELRETYCLTDNVMQKAGQHDLSGYFLIEDTFCLVIRPRAVGYGELVLNWLRNSNDELSENGHALTALWLESHRRS